MTTQFTDTIRILNKKNRHLGWIEEQQRRISAGETLRVPCVEAYGRKFDILREDSQGVIRGIIKRDLERTRRDLTKEISDLLSQGK